MSHPRGEPAFVPSQMDKPAFIARFGTAFRNGQLLAGRAFDGGLDTVHDTPSGLFLALRTQFRAASEAERRHVLSAYTPLNPRIAAAGIVASEAESKSLDLMTERQKQRLLELLDLYTKKFGFGAIFAVRDYTTASLLAALEQRYLAGHETEMAATWREIERLAEIQVNLAFAE